jgi:competence protein ComEA
MATKKIIQDYLSFNRRDRIAVIVLVLLIGIIYFLPVYFSRKQMNIDIRPGSYLERVTDSLEKQEAIEIPGKAGDGTTEKEPVKGLVFKFDPNKLDPEGWKKLGLKDYTIQTINHFLSKGGSFRKPEDLQKIYGLPKGFYERVRDYIAIETVFKPRDTLFHVQPDRRKISPVDVNMGDSSAFIALPGIGSKLAARIIRFRDKLGGFYSIDQVGETFGLPDSVFQKNKPWFLISGSVKKIRINEITKEELKDHPYIRWNLANAIVSYRDQHGPFKSLEELKNIALVNEQTFDKLKHYLTVE